MRQMQSSTDSLGDVKKYESAESNQTLEKIQKLKQEILSYQKNIKDNATFINVEADSSRASEDYSPTPQKISKILVKTRKVFEEDKRVQDTDESDLEDRRLEEEWKAKRQGRSLDKTKKILTEEE